MVNCSHFLPAKQNSWTTKGNGNDNSKWVCFPWMHSWSEIPTFGSGGFDKGVESSKSNLSNLHCGSQTNFWRKGRAGTYPWHCVHPSAGSDGQCYLCYSGDGAVAGHEWCWPGLPRRHGPHWTWICDDDSVHSISMNPCLRGGIERAIPQQSKALFDWRPWSFGRVQASLIRNIARNIGTSFFKNCQHCKLSRFNTIVVSLWACLHSFILCSKHRKILSSTLAALLVETKSV